MGSSQWMSHEFFIFYLSILIYLIVKYPIFQGFVKFVFEDIDEVCNVDVFKFWQKISYSDTHAYDSSHTFYRGQGS